jgi:hypothetical protein
MQPKMEGCRLAPRKTARYQEVQYPEERAECSPLGKGRPSPRGCGPGVDGNETELAIAETNTMKAYSGRVVQIAREKKRQNNGGKERKLWGGSGVWVALINAGAKGSTTLMRTE